MQKTSTTDCTSAEHLVLKKSPHISSIIQNNTSQRKRPNKNLFVEQTVISKTKNASVIFGFIQRQFFFYLFTIAFFTQCKNIT